MAKIKMVPTRTKAVHTKGLRKTTIREDAFLERMQRIYGTNYVSLEAKLTYALRFLHSENHKHVVFRHNSVLITLQHEEE